MIRNILSIGCSVLLGVTTSLALVSLSAQVVPGLINYQGKLVGTNGLPLATAEYPLQFRIYDAFANGNLIWGPQVFDGVAGVGHGGKVSVIQGWFNVLLGPTDTNAISITNAFGGTNRFLEIQVGTNPPVLPRQQVLSAPFALTAGFAQNASFASVAAVANSLSSQSTAGPLTIWVAPNGNDSDTGLSSEVPKRTIQAAIDSLPRQIDHRVRVHILPGLYREQVKVIDKAVSASRGASLELIGYSSALGSVVISGDDSNGVRARSDTLFIGNSSATAYNLVFSNAVQRAVTVLYRSEFGLTRCQIRDIPDGVLVGAYSRGSLEDVLIEHAGPANGAAVEVEAGSIVAFRDDHVIPADDNEIPGLPGDPGNTFRNTIRNYSVGVASHSAALVRGTTALIFDQVTTPTQAIAGGQIIAQ